MTKKLIDTGRVSTVNEINCTAKVYFEDTEYMSADLPILFQSNSDWIPQIGAMVTCIFLDNSTAGFIIGTFKSEGY